jgi:hypothetical protein
MRPAATLIISLVMALGAIGLAVAAPGGNRQAASADLQNASGALAISNSHADEAVLQVDHLRPGDGAQGAVTIGNAGDVPGDFAVDLSAVQDVAGAGGGLLSQRLQLALIDVTHAQTVYAGTPAEFEPVDLGRFAAGESRDYLVAATLPDGGVSGIDNAYQGARLSLGLVWSATAVPSATPTPRPSATPTPKPKPKPKPRPTPTPKPTKPKPPVTTPPAVTPFDLASALGLPPASKCIKKRKLKFKVKAPYGAKPKSAKIAVNGKTKLRVKGRKLRRTVTLKKLRKRSTIKLRVKASNRHTYTASRTYRACAKRRR